MKQNTKIVLITLALGLLSSLADAQTKDSIKVAKTDLQTIQRNALIIQQTLHRMDMSALLRDKLDSVYNQSAIIVDERLKVKKP